ncbi:DUF4124 domain-containing protein [Luteimonas aquatica]|uniref:DUF4124 domain-containing protein n=1 Tax=Luteimonas aquatica TaxID=450364 RepID=UPI001F55C7F3|nr:DUF4124 domain-containing protein [Luteimonas aquatica]
MSRKSPSTLLGQALLLPALALISLAVPAQEVYQWKDARGVTHYSETPPPNGQYQQQKVARDDVSPPAKTATAAAAPKPAADQGKPAGENAQCVAARKNLEILESKGDVVRDTDGDGKPDKTLSADERSNQMELARATLKANCG